MATAPAFWDKVADKYSRKPIADQAAYERKLEITRGYLGPEMDVLELGCGTGGTAILHAPHVRHIRATDISTKMIAIGRRKAAAENIENITFEQVSVEELDAVDESLDAVLGLSLLHLHFRF